MLTKETVELIDEKQIVAALRETIPQLANDDAELLQFIAQEINSNKLSNLSSSATLFTAISEHLSNFGCCDCDEDAKFICDNIVEELERTLAQHKNDESKDDGYLSDKDYGDGTCLLCERDMPLTFHHLIPRTTHKKLLKRGYERKELNSGIMICRPCHSAIHRFIPEETMAMQFNTLETLVQHEKVQKWIPYAQKQKVVGKEKAQLYATGVLRYAK